MKIKLSKEKYSIESNGKNRVYYINGVPVNLNETPVQLIHVEPIREFLMKTLESLHEVSDDIIIHQDFDDGSIMITCDGRNLYIEGTFTSHRLQINEGYDDCEMDEDIIDDYCGNLEYKNQFYNQKIHQKALKIFEELNKQMDSVEESFR